MTILRVALTVVLLTATGCAKYEAWRNPEVAACEGYLKETLKSPSSYKRASFAKVDTPVSKDVLADAVGLNGELGKTLADYATAPGIRGVLIAYDAENGFGSSMRSDAVCYFAMSDIKNNRFALELEQQASGASAVLSSAKVKVLMGGEAEEGGLCCLNKEFNLDRLHSAQDAEMKRSSSEGGVAMDADSPASHPAKASK